MRTVVENYRGWEISFNTDTESFYAESDEHDQSHAKRSYGSAKKYIDDFIKDNLKFEPVWVEKSGNVYMEPRRKKIIGIRKDGKFVYEEKGRPVTMSEYSENEYYLVDERNKEVEEKILGLNQKITELEQQVKELEASKTKVTLKQLKAKYTI